MTSTIDDNGAAIAVTLLAAKPNTVNRIKSVETDGYTAIQIGDGKNMREIKISDIPEDIAVGGSLAADSFSVGDKVDVTAIGKGKGFAGTIKRHNFARGRKTHGGRSYRRPGSIGSMYPQRIFPGKKMAGQMGAKQVTTKGLKIALVDTELAVIGVAGSVPGPKKAIVLIKGADR